MTERSDREFLLSIFLVEAWDTAGSLEEGLGSLAYPAEQAEGATGPLLVLAHRLKGSAALHGFSGVSALAGIAEAQLERARAAGLPERARTRRLLADLVTLLKESLDAIGTTSVEAADRIAAFRGRHPSLFSEADAAAAPPRETAARAPQGGGAPRIVQDLEHFFADENPVLEYFGQEAAEHLEVMTASLLAIEREDRQEEELAALFRAAHTLKGAAYTVGCAPIGDVAHRLEDLLVVLRDGRLPLAPAAVEAAFAGVDALKLMLDGPATPRAELVAALARAESSLGALMAVGGPAVESELRAERAAGLVAATAPEDISTEAAEPERAVTAATARQAGRGARHVPGASPSIRVKLGCLDSMMDLVGELMIARSRLDRRLAQLDRVGGLLLFSRSRMGRAVRDFEGQHHDPQLAGAAGAKGRGPESGASGASIADLFAELEFDRYDEFDILARSVGEISADLGEAQAQHAALLRAIRDDVEHIQRLTAALRKEVTGARMIPIGRLFTRFARQVREAARTAGKTILLETHGESAEVDSTVVEQVSDSLLHVVQNAISHGIEPESERLARGKRAQGTVSLRASQQGGFIFIEVEDDGRGMDAELLRQRAVEQGLLRPEEARALSIPEALNLIFVPGFSTVSTVTKASGRGVGLDVVRTNVNRLSGEVEVQTELGARTRFTFKLPLTVAIADALMVRVGAEVLAIPLTTVGVMRLVEPAAIQSVGDREMVELDTQVMEMIRLDRVLGLGASEPVARVPVVVLRAGGLPFAVAVDELLGKQEIVVKGLGAFLEGKGPFAGATISAGGRVILLVDPTHLFEMNRAVTRPRLLGESRVEPSAPAAAASILLVDDSISVRKFVGQMLDRAGFRVFTAADGQDALDQLAELSVDALITDLEMPRVNGYALIEDLRRRPGTRNVPVVVLTTRAGDKHVSLAHRLGVRHYVTKPVEEHAFVRLIASILSPASSEAALSGVGSA